MKYVLVAILSVAIFLAGFLTAKWTLPTTPSVVTTVPAPPTPSAATGAMQKPNQNNQMSPPGDQGPFTHSIRTASSTDGLTWTSDSDTPVAEHASVPAIIAAADGTVRIYYVDATNGPEALGCQESTDNGKTFVVKTCMINGLTGRAVDYSIVQLDDGRYRLYYYNYFPPEQVNSSTAHLIKSAISTDGLTFTEESTVFTHDGLVDPDVFWNGSQWIMHVFSLSDNATIVATSTGGIPFTKKGTLSPSGYGLTKPVTLEDGTFRMYAFKQGGGNQNSFVSLTSKDGLAWTLEEGTRFLAPTGYEITDPSVARLSDGTFKMVYKLSAKPMNAR